MEDDEGLMLSCSECGSFDWEITEAGDIYCSICECYSGLTAVEIQEEVLH